MQSPSVPVKKRQAASPRKHSATAEKNGNNDFHIAGIRASAGGLEALKDFFSGVKEKTGIAYVVIQHLAPTNNNILPDLITRMTRLRVVQVRDNIKVKPDRIYIIPPNKLMTISRGCLMLSTPENKASLRMSIDLFFRSLAADMGDKAIGIVLSGTGTDGSLGLREIRNRGGAIAVQEPASAKFDGMPNSALDTVLTDITAPAGQLIGKLLSYLENKPLVCSQPEPTKNESSQFNEIMSMVLAKTGNDFSNYKQSTISRRIERRMGIHQFSKVSSYLRYLHEYPEELEQLNREMMIGVTGFFRDGEVWDTLKEKILPQMLPRFPDGYTLRAWVPGCSTGEEAYSLAIIFKEAVEKFLPRKRLFLQIFATDLDGEAIDRARKGEYPLTIASEVSKERLARYFIADTPGSYKVKPELNETIVFARQNILKDPPFRRLDVITARNLLIYMEDDMKSRLQRLFHYSLNPNGLLVLGISESITEPGDLFIPADMKSRTYWRSPFQSVPVSYDFFSSGSQASPLRNLQGKCGMPLSPGDWFNEKRMMELFLHPGVLVNSKGDIIFVSGSIGKYLETAAGRASLNVFAMVRNGSLRKALPETFRMAVKTSKKITLKGMTVHDESLVRRVDVSIQAAEDSGHAGEAYLILFYEADHGLTAGKRRSGKKVKRRKGGAVIKCAEKDNSKEILLRTIEDMQNLQDDLRTANEELQAINEELQAANEELSTTKSEIQGLNDNLEVSNSELIKKINESRAITKDIYRLIDRARITFLFLDENLCVKGFTEEADKIFRLQNSDIGRPLTDIACDLNYTEMEKDIERVIKTEELCEKELSTYDGRKYSVRIIPERAKFAGTGGVSLAFIENKEI